MRGLVALAIALAFGPREGVAFAPSRHALRGPAPRADTARGAMTMGLFDGFQDALDGISPVQPGRTRVPSPYRARSVPGAGDYVSSVQPSAYPL